MPRTTWTEHQSQKITTEKQPGSEAPRGEGIERVLGALENVQPSGDGWQALCPVHDDRQASLSINVGNDGRTLLYCHAGCDVSDVVSAIGLEMKDLFPASAPLEDTQYIYMDENAEPLYMVKRYYDQQGQKHFAQYHWDGDKFVIGGMKDIRRVPYRLPELLMGVAKGHTIQIFEGEKDVDRWVSELGIPATCNSGGAGEGDWSQWAPMFKGARVFLWPDNDEAGRRHMETVGRALINDVGELLVMVLPDLKEKGDISDWLDAGGTVDEIASIMGNVWTPDADLADADVLEMDATDGFRLNEVGDSHRLIKLSVGKLRYVMSWDKWLAYKDGRYITDGRAVVAAEYAKQVPLEILANLPAPGTRLANDGFNGALQDQRDREKKWAKRMENDAPIQKMIHLSRGAVSIDHDELDADPELLNVLNKTINLRTGEARDHNPDDLLTLQAPVQFDESATAPLWLECLETWMPDPEMRRYLQVRAGACITGYATETFDVDYGEGGNGKGKFHGAIQHILGPYAVVPHKSLLVADGNEQHDTIRAALFRARYAIASETKKRCTLNEEQVKNLTGGDVINARRMREDPWEFNPSHTLVLMTNYEPIIQGTDEGIWRRVRKVPWEVTIPEADRDIHLDVKLRAESSGILNWLIEGARIFLADGLMVPERIRVSTEKYRAGEDVLGRFLNEALIFESGASVPTADISIMADAWMAAQGLHWKLRMNDIASALERRGAVNLGRQTIGGVKQTIWSGIRVSTPNQ